MQYVTLLIVLVLNHSSKNIIHFELYLSTWTHWSFLCATEILIFSIFGGTDFRPKLLNGWWQIFRFLDNTTKEVKKSKSEYLCDQLILPSDFPGISVAETE